MFGQFLHIVVSCLKLDRNIFKDPKYFGEAAIYFAGLIMILDGVAGAVAANTFVKTSIGVSGITALATWVIWAIFIYVIGVKLFPDGNSKTPFKKILIGVGYAHAPGLIRFFAVTQASNTNCISYTILDICCTDNFNKTYFKYKI